VVTRVSARKTIWPSRVLVDAIRLPARDLKLNVLRRALVEEQGALALCSLVRDGLSRGEALLRKFDEGLPDVVDAEHR
jgi:hypothetical protein